MRPSVATEEKNTERFRKVARKSRIEWERLPALLYVVKCVTLAGPKTYVSRDVAVATVIADMMGPEPGPSGCAQVCFASIKTIGARAKTSAGTVKRAVKILCEGELALFVRVRGGVTRGHPHSCNRYELDRTAHERMGLGGISDRGSDQRDPFPGSE